MCRLEDRLSLHRADIEALARLAHLRRAADGAGEIGVDESRGQLGETRGGLDEMLERLDVVLGWLASLQQVDVEGVPETDTHALAAVALRADTPGPVLDRELVLAGVPEADEGHVVVPRFVEE